MSQGHFQSLAVLLNGFAEWNCLSGPKALLYLNATRRRAKVSQRAPLGSQALLHFPAKYATAVCPTSAGQSEKSSGQNAYHIFPQNARPAPGCLPDAGAALLCGLEKRSIDNTNHFGISLRARPLPNHDSSPRPGARRLAMSEYHLDAQIPVPAVHAIAGLASPAAARRSRPGTAFRRVIARRALYASRSLL